MTKAFHSVEIEKLIEYLTHSNTCSPDTIKLIRFLLSDMTAKIKYNKKLGESFPCNVGLPEGCPLSSILFTIYTCIIVKELYNTLPYTLLLALMYSDDIDFSMKNISKQDKVRIKQIMSKKFAE